MKRIEHPAPQWMRNDIYMLDGTWECDGSDIRVPYAPQAKLSGYNGKVGDVLHYKMTFDIPGSFLKERILLHFGAADQIADVSINGRNVGHHEGGYLAFTYDITDVVKRDSKNVLEVTATDTLSHHYPYGKQRHKRGGMWYTPVSGIWQSVWLENVAGEYLLSARITPDLNGFKVEAISSADPTDIRLRLYLPEGRKKVAYDMPLDRGIGYADIAKINQALGIEEELRLWSPDSPYLYEFDLLYKDDKVSSYTALREISVKEIAGINRVCLNGIPVFLHGLLDQGYFLDGLYTAPSVHAYERDIVGVKSLGYNFLRKHIKVEPEAFYYAADALGILVMQDMVNSGPYEYFSETIFPNLTFKKRPDTFFKDVDRGRKDFFIQHCRDTIDQLYNHPSIIAYTIFNEGWGQFESDRLYTLMKEWDPTRLIDSTSGWFAQKLSDFRSEHIYFMNTKLTPGKRPLLLSECGGYAFSVDGHAHHEKPWTIYGKANSREDLTRMIRLMYLDMVIPAINDGMCGCVYTQLSDIEDEINGIFTYDREYCKVIPDEMRLMARTLRAMLAIECGF